MNLLNVGFLISTTPSLSPHSLHAMRAMGYKEYVSKRVNIARSCLKPPDLEYNTNRRSANYHRTVWDYGAIQSLNSPYTYDRFDSYLEKLKQDVKHFLRSAKDSVRRLEIIGASQRLGVGYHFEEDIKQALDLIFYSSECYNSEDVYFTALCFRILRQNRYHITSDVFSKFSTQHIMSQDVKGLLSLYEASFLAIQGEDILEEAGLSAMNRLNALVINDQGVQFDQSLQNPIHWKALRMGARKFIGIYEKDDTRNSSLLELAKLDFNLVQSVHQKDLVELSSWWRDLGFTEKLPFSRDRLVENFIWAVGIIYQPQFSKCRIGLTKFICILTAIDDMYDVYGSLHELELFTAAVSRWSIGATEELPDYMKICYKAMFDFANSISSEIHREQGINVLPYIAKEWERLCQAYIVEARWFNRNYTPTLDEYIENAWTSVGGPGAMMHAYILQGETITTDSLDCLSNRPELIYAASLITRLSDDLGTSKAEMMRGDVPKSIQCHMNETGVSDEEAREHIRSLMRLSWKNLNEECLTSSLPKCIATMALNMVRSGQCLFENGDGIGSADGETKDRALLFFVEPLHIEGNY